ncbi:hypothetical protein J5Y03_10165 [Bacillus sp. RG28]|uniref:Uncharacterized protein n=1 Tax=Gottfriedia endophytica TaxID=2820819 RepID=A0A940SGW8_9BACI|nr:hypothetical protein [Gottfriedia endophytica]MBP0725552.1 hypothetical protein [Gottfriedia endophytica]
MKLNNIIFSEDGDVAYGKVSEFINADKFIKAVQEQHYQEICIVENIKIETCISTLEGIGADMITPLSSTDVVIENYFVADVSEIGIAGKEKE